MKSLNIKYQTSELVPPPFANAIEIKFTFSEIQQASYEFDQEYIERDGLSFEEIQNEGFFGEDDIQATGLFHENWKNELNKLLKKTKRTYPTELHEHEDYWQIEEGGDVFYPANAEEWKEFIEEFLQAVLEQNDFEKPLQIKIIRKSSSGNQEYELTGKFTDRVLYVKYQSKPEIQLDWKIMKVFLGNLFSGEFNYKNAQQKIGKFDGIYVNTGDDNWFEVGKSLLIQPSKITAWLDAHATY